MARQDYLKVILSQALIFALKFIQSFAEKSMKKSHRPTTKVKNPEPKPGSPDWVIWAAWADRITFEEIEMINHDLPAKKNTVADHPQGWKPLTLIWENNQWMIKPDDGRVIMLHHSNGHSFNNSKL